MSIENKNRQDRDKAAYTDNPIDQGIDRRVSIKDYGDPANNHIELNQLVTLALNGYQPVANYDKITQTKVSASIIEYNFFLNDTTQFTVQISGADTNTPTVTVIENKALLLEQSSTDALITEAGEELLKENI